MIAPIVGICIVGMITTYADGGVRAAIMIAGVGVVLSVLQFAWDKWKYPKQIEIGELSCNP